MRGATKSVLKHFKHQHPGAALAVMLLAVPFMYLAAMGPYMYFGEFYYGSRGAGSWSIGSGSVRACF